MMCQLTSSKEIPEQTIYYAPFEYPHIYACTAALVEGSKLREYYFMNPVIVTENNL